MFEMGPGELFTILLIVLIVFGGTRLDRLAPELGRWSRWDWVRVGSAVALALAALLIFAGRHHR
jgi:hypothetical protein